MEDRLSKVIALAGIASRRESDRLVREGRVTVNGAVVEEPGHKVDLERDHVKVDGRLVSQLPSNTYIVVNKPSGVLATRTDAAGRPTVVSMLRAGRTRLIPVGKLEADDEGLMLLTNDGTLALGLSNPQTGIPRTYLVKVRGIPDDKILTKLRTGVPLEDGRTLPMEVRVVSVTSRNAWMQVVTREARPRLVKRVMLRLKNPVLKLKRTGFGPLTVKGLAPGTFRKLTDEEVRVLKGLIENPPGLPEAIYSPDAILPPEDTRPPVRRRNAPTRQTRDQHDDDSASRAPARSGKTAGSTPRRGGTSPRGRSRTS